MDLVSSLIRSKAQRRFGSEQPNAVFGRYIEIYGDNAYIAYRSPRDLIVNVSRLLAKEGRPLRVVLCKLPEGYYSDDLVEASGSAPMQMTDLHELLSGFGLSFLEPNSINCEDDRSYEWLTWPSSALFDERVDEVLRTLSGCFSLETALFSDGVKLEYLGLEVARKTLESDSTVVGTSERDRQARELMYVTGYEVKEELGRVISQLQTTRSSFKSHHPHALVCRDRWLRVQISNHPEVIGFESLTSIELGSVDDTSPRCYGVGRSMDGLSSLLCFMSGPDLMAPFEAVLVLSALQNSSFEAPVPTKISFITQRRNVTEAFRTILSRSSRSWEIVSVSERWFDIAEKRNSC